MITRLVGQRQEPLPVLCAPFGPLECSGRVRTRVVTSGKARSTRPRLICVVTRCNGGRNAARVSRSVASVPTTTSAPPTDSHPAPTRGHAGKRGESEIRARLAVAWQLPPHPASIFPPLSSRLFRSFGPRATSGTDGWCVSDDSCERRSVKSRRAPGVQSWRRL